MDLSTSKSIGNDLWQVKGAGFPYFIVKTISEEHSVQSYFFCCCFAKISLIFVANDKHSGIEFMEGFLLGLANGTFCFAYCAPILVPYLLSEAKNVQRNFITISYFLSGRLLGVSYEKARLMFIYPAFLFLAIMGSGMITGAIYRVSLLITTGSMIK